MENDSEVFKPSFQTFFFLKRRSEKLTDHFTPQAAMVDMMKAVDVDSGRREGERERNLMCLQALPPLSLGAAHTAAGMDAAYGCMVWMERCSDVFFPPRHRCFQP